MEEELAAALAAPHGGGAGRGSRRRTAAYMRFEIIRKSRVFLDRGAGRACVGPRPTFPWTTMLGLGGWGSYAPGTDRRGIGLEDGLSEHGTCNYCFETFIPRMRPVWA